MTKRIIKGYKAFNKDHTNRYGVSFEAGMTYSIDGPVAFGNDGNGFHFCERLEDTLRYFDGRNGEVAIAEVIGSGDVVEAYDDFYGYYNMYVVSNLTVVKFLSREEIIDNFLNVIDVRAERFVSGFRLDDEEIARFKLQYMGTPRILRAIAYYQENDKDAYSQEKAYTYFKAIGVREGENNE